MTNEAERATRQDKLSKALSAAFLTHQIAQLESRVSDVNLDSRNQSPAGHGQRGGDAGHRPHGPRGYQKEGPLDRQTLEGFKTLPPRPGSRVQQSHRQDLHESEFPPLGSEAQDRDKQTGRGYAGRYRDMLTGTRGGMREYHSFPAEGMETIGRIDDRQDDRDERHSTTMTSSTRSGHSHRHSRRGHDRHTRREMKDEERKRRRSERSLRKEYQREERHARREERKETKDQRRDERAQYRDFQREDREDRRRRRKDGDGRDSGCWRVVVMDASALLWAMKSVRRSVNSGWEVIIPIEAMRTLDLLKTGSTDSARAARAATRYIEHASRHWRLLDPSQWVISMPNELEVQDDGGEPGQDKGQATVHYQSGRGLRLQRENETRRPDEVSLLPIPSSQEADLPPWLVNVLSCAAYFTQIVHLAHTSRKADVASSDMAHARVDSPPTPSAEGVLMVANPSFEVELDGMGFSERGEGFAISQEAQRYEIPLEVLRDEDWEFEHRERAERGERTERGDRGERGERGRGRGGRGRGRGGRRPEMDRGDGPPELHEDAEVQAEILAAKEEAPREIKILLKRPSALPDLGEDKRKKSSRGEDHLSVHGQSHTDRHAGSSIHAHAEVSSVGVIATSSPRRSFDVDRDRPSDRSPLLGMESPLIGGDSPLMGGTSDLSPRIGTVSSRSKTREISVSPRVDQLSPPFRSVSDAPHEPRHPSTSPGAEPRAEPKEQTRSPDRVKLGDRKSSNDPHHSPPFTYRPPSFSSPNQIPEFHPRIRPPPFFPPEAPGPGPGLGPGPGPGPDGFRPPWPPGPPWHARPPRPWHPRQPPPFGAHPGHGWDREHWGRPAPPWHHPPGPPPPPPQHAVRPGRPPPHDAGHPLPPANFARSLGPFFSDQIGRGGGRRERHPASISSSDSSLSSTDTEDSDSHVHHEDLLEAHDDRVSQNPSGDGHDRKSVSGQFEGEEQDMEQAGNAVRDASEIHEQHDLPNGAYKQGPEPLLPSRGMGRGGLGMRGNRGMRGFGLGISHHQSLGPHGVRTAQGADGDHEKGGAERMIWEMEHAWRGRGRGRGRGVGGFDGADVGGGRGMRGGRGRGRGGGGGPNDFVLLKRPVPALEASASLDRGLRHGGPTRRGKAHATNGPETIREDTAHRGLYDPRQDGLNLSQPQHQQTRDVNSRSDGMHKDPATSTSREQRGRSQTSSSSDFQPEGGPKVLLQRPKG